MIGVTKDLVNVDLRESLYNGHAVGLAQDIQLPREAVTRLHGLVIDLDANVLKPNPWFPPAETAESFLTGITPVLSRHPILRHAEIRDTGRWLHAIVWFKDAIELHTAADQQRALGLHRMLKASVPSDPAAQALITMTRPVGSINSKTGMPVRMLRPGDPVPADVFLEWANEVQKKPFETLGMILFGERRTKPCPYCDSENSYLDLGEVVGFCYGPCKRVPLKRIHEPFFKGTPTTKNESTPNPDETTPPKKTGTKRTKRQPRLDRKG